MSVHRLGLQQEAIRLCFCDDHCDGVSTQVLNGGGASGDFKLLKVIVFSCISRVGFD